MARSTLSPYTCRVGVLQLNRKNAVIINVIIQQMHECESVSIFHFSMSVISGVILIYINSVAVYSGRTLSHFINLLWEFNCRKMYQIFEWQQMLTSAFWVSNSNFYCRSSYPRYDLWDWITAESVLQVPITERAKARVTRATRESVPKLRRE